MLLAKVHNPVEFLFTKITAPKYAVHRLLQPAAALRPNDFRLSISHSLPTKGFIKDAPPALSRGRDDPRVCTA
jgi:hypothetical protein